MAGKTKPGIPVKGINIKLKMINDLMNVTGSAKDSWNPAEISDDMKAISYIHDLADTWNPAQLNEALKYLGFATIDSWNPAIIEETKNKLVKYFLPTDASGNPIELDLKGVLPYEVTALTIDLLPIQNLNGYNSPWFGGTGKNKYPIKIGRDSFNDNVNGTHSTNNDILTVNMASSINSGAYSRGIAELNKLIGKYSETVTYSFYIKSNVEGNINVGYEDYGFRTIASTTDWQRISINTTAATVEKSFLIYNASEVERTVEIKDFMFELGSTVSNYEPYENICPITGRDSVTLTVNGDDIETTFENTVYGGTLDLVSGKLTIDTKYSLFDGTESGWSTRTGGAGQLFEITLTESVTQSDPQIGKCNELNWNNYLTTEYSYRIRNTTLAVCLPSSYSTVEDFTTWLSTNNLQITYPLNTPIEVTLTPEEIELVNGENTLSTDGDNINITYKANLNS